MLQLVTAVGALSGTVFSLLSQGAGKLCKFPLPFIVFKSGGKCGY